jgi:hypothetical protein
MFSCRKLAETYKLWSGFIQGCIGGFEFFWHLTEGVIMRPVTPVGFGAGGSGRGEIDGYT